jgi:hypothetical protein
MRWMLWGRQYGKTYQTIQWFLEEPTKRVIVCGTEAMAADIRRSLRQKIPHGPLVPETGLIMGAGEWSRLLDKYIMNAASASGRLSGVRKQVAVDNLEFVLPQLLGNNKVELVTATGVNEMPPPFVVNP